MRGWVCNLLYSCFWALPEQSLLDRSPAELTAIFYCFIWYSPNLWGQAPVFISPRNRVAQLYPTVLGSLSVASYDSQGLRWRYSNQPPHRKFTGFSEVCIGSIFKAKLCRWATSLLIVCLAYHRYRRSMLYVLRNIGIGPLCYTASQTRHGDCCENQNVFVCLFVCLFVCWRAGSSRKSWSWLCIVCFNSLSMLTC
jgi:hypothetical protein